VYLRISDLAGSSGCVPYLTSKLRRSSGRWRGGSSPDFSQNFSQELGTAVHELIQYILKQPPDKREHFAKECAYDLEMLRTNLEPSNLLKQALPKQFLERGLRFDKIMKAWEHGARLLPICIDFLSRLESYYADSKNKWRVDIEVSLHENTLAEYQHNPPSTRHITDREIALHGSVDLVFRWNHVRILGELKTGKKANGKKKKTWKDQVAIYSDIWKEKHPEHEVYGMVFHASEKPIPAPSEYPFSELSEINRRVGGAQCTDCSEKLFCEKSIFRHKRKYY